MFTVHLHKLVSNPSNQSNSLKLDAASINSSNNGKDFDNNLQSNACQLNAARKNVKSQQDVLILKRSIESVSNIPTKENGIISSKPLKTTTSAMENNEKMFLDDDESYETEEQLSKTQSSQRKQTKSQPFLLVGQTQDAIKNNIQFAALASTSNKGKSSQQATELLASTSQPELINSEQKAATILKRLHDFAHKKILKTHTIYDTKLENTKNRGCYIQCDLQDPLVPSTAINLVGKNYNYQPNEFAQNSRDCLNVVLNPLVQCHNKHSELDTKKSCMISKPNKSKLHEIFINNNINSDNNWNRYAVYAADNTHLDTIVAPKFRKLPPQLRKSAKCQKNYYKSVYKNNVNVSNKSAKIYDKFCRKLELLGFRGSKVLHHDLDTANFIGDDKASTSSSLNGLQSLENGDITLYYKSYQDFMHQKMKFNDNDLESDGKYRTLLWHMDIIDDLLDNMDFYPLDASKRGNCSNSMNSILDKELKALEDLMERIEFIEIEWDELNKALDSDCKFGALIKKLGVVNTS